MYLPTLYPSSMMHCYTSTQAHILPPSSPSRRLGFKAQAARYHAMVTRGTAGRSDYIITRKDSARSRSKKLAHKSYPVHFVVEHHISYRRRDQMGEIVDDLYWPGSKLRSKRKRTTRRHYTLPLETPEPVRRRTTHPVTVIIENMEIDEPVYGQYGYGTQVKYLLL